MKTKSLTLIAGTIWLLAGFNVCRIGVVSWMDLETTSVLMVVGSIVTLLFFSTMFVKSCSRMCGAFVASKLTSAGCGT